jgi:5-methylcytosine-specific restriction protein A
MDDASPTSAPRNPAWGRDELILALDLYMTNPVSPPGKTSAEVVSISKLLNRMAPTPGMAKFRNPAFGRLRACTTVLK